VCGFILFNRSLLSERTFASSFAISNLTDMSNYQHCHPSQLVP
jgi:hypothetical protein